MYDDLDVFNLENTKKIFFCMKKTACVIKLCVICKKQYMYSIILLKDINTVLFAWYAETKIDSQSWLNIAKHPKPIYGSLVQSAIYKGCQTNISSSLSFI